MFLNTPDCGTKPVHRIPADIPDGTVFSGVLYGHAALTEPTSGYFLKVQSHILDLKTFVLHGAGKTGGAHDFRISFVGDYKEYPNSTLEVRE